MNTHPAASNMTEDESKDISTTIVVSDSDSSGKNGHPLQKSTDESETQEEDRLKTQETNDDESEESSSDDDDDDDDEISHTSGWSALRREFRAEVAGEINTRKYIAEEGDEIDPVERRKLEMLAQAKAELKSEKNFSRFFYDKGRNEEDIPDGSEAHVDRRRPLLYERTPREYEAYDYASEDDSMSISFDDDSAVMELKRSLVQVPSADSEEEETTSHRKEASQNFRGTAVGDPVVKRDALPETVSEKENDGHFKRAAYLRGSQFQSTPTIEMYQSFDEETAVTKDDLEFLSDEETDAIKKEHTQKSAKITTPKTRNKTNFTNSGSTKTKVEQPSNNKMTSLSKGDLFDNDDEEISFADTTTDGKPFAKKRMGKPTEKYILGNHITVNRDPFMESMISLGSATLDDDGMSFDDDSNIHSNIPRFSDSAENLLPKLDGEEDSSFEAVPGTASKDAGNETVKSKEDDAPLDISMLNMSIDMNNMITSVKDDLSTYDDEETSHDQGIGNGKNLLENVAKGERNDDGGKNDATDKLTNKDWITKLFEGEDKADDSGSTKQAHETQLNIHVSDSDIGNDAEEVHQLKTKAITGRSETTSRIDGVKSMRTFDEMKKSKKKKNMLAMSMNGISIGSEYASNFNVEDLLLSDEEMSFDGDDSKSKSMITRRVGEQASAMKEKDDAVRKENSSIMRIDGVDNVRTFDETKKSKKKKKNRIDGVKSMRTFDEMKKSKKKKNMLAMSMNGISIGPEYASNFNVEDLLQFSDEEMSFDGDDRKSNPPRRNDETGIADDEAKSVLRGVAKGEQNNNRRRNDKISKISETDWVVNLFNVEDNPETPVAVGLSREIQVDGGAVEDEEDSTAKGVYQSEANAANRDKLTSSAWKEDENVIRRKRNANVERVQGRAAKSARTITGGSRAKPPKVFRFGSARKRNFENVHDVAANDYNDNMYIVTAGGNVDNDNIIQQHTDYGNNNAGILTRTELPNNEQELGVVLKRPSIDLSEIQMIQSLKLAMEADARGNLEFRTRDHLSKLEISPVLTWDYSDKSSIKWQITMSTPRLEDEKPRLEDEKPRLEEEKHNFVCRLMRRFTFGIQKSLCGKPGVRRRKSHENLLTLEHQSGLNSLYQEGSQYL